MSEHGGIKREKILVPCAGGGGWREMDVEEYRQFLRSGVLTIDPALMRGVVLRDVPFADAYDFDIVFDVSHSDVEVPQLPAGAFLVDAVLPPEQAEESMYHLHARFDHWTEKHGRLRANFIFYCQAVGTVVGYWTDGVIKRVRAIRFPRAS